MKHCDFGVGLAAAEGRHEINHRLAAHPVDPLQRLGKQVLQSPGDEGAREELLRVAVLGARDTKANLPEICSELGQLVGALSHVIVWLDDFPPGRQARCCQVHGQALLRSC